MSFRPTIWARLKQRFPGGVSPAASMSTSSPTPKSHPNPDPGPGGGSRHFNPGPRARAFGRFGFYLFVFASWVPVSTMFNEYVLEVTTINGFSMYPFLNAERDRTLRRDLVLTFKYGAQRDLQRGMIVTFW